MKMQRKINLSHNGIMNKEKTLDEKLFDLLKEDGNQSAAGLAEILGSSPRTVQRALKRLMSDGKIEHVGLNRFGHYVIKQDLQNVIIDGAINDVIEGMGLLRIYCYDFHCFYSVFLYLYDYTDFYFFYKF